MATDYSFIYNDGKKTKRGLTLPSIRLPKPIAFGVLVAVLILLLFLVLALRGGGSSGSPFFNLAARQTEIMRVANLASGNIKDVQVENLDKTILAVFASEQNQSASLLNVKATDSRFNAGLNRQTDSTLQNAQQNNNYDDTYLGLIKQSLTAYEQAVNTTQATSATGQAVLQTDLSDSQALLASPLLKGL